MLGATFDFFSLVFGHEVKQSGPKQATAPVAGVAASGFTGWSCIERKFCDDRE
jgi:hypothetical protein